MWWNILDFIIVSLGIMDLFVFFLLGMTMSVSPQTLRTLRFIRVVKIIRVARAVQFIKDLRLMLQCVIGSLTTMFWSFVLLGGFALIFATLLVQQVGTAIYEKGFDDELVSLLYTKFGSVATAFMTLFKCISGGEDWGDVYSLTQPIGPFCSANFLIYILFVWMSVTNIITAVFVDKALRHARPQIEDQVLEKHRKDLRQISELESLFVSMDKDGSETLTFSELSDAPRDFRVMSYFELHGVDIKDIEMFFKLLAQVSGSFEINMESFVSGCLRMKGYATNVDVFCLLYQNKTLGEKMTRFIHKCSQEIRKLRKDILAPENIARVERGKRESEGGDIEAL